MGWARCLTNQGKQDEARGILAGLLESDPDYFDARLAMGQLEQASGQPQKAIRWLQQACDERPYDTEARYMLAMCLQATGKTETAKGHFKFVAEAREGMLEVQNLTEMVRSDPQNFEARYKIGMALLRYDDPSHGVAWLRSGLELRPRHRPTLEALAEHFESQENKKLAEQYRRQIDQTKRNSD